MYISRGILGSEKHFTSYFIKPIQEGDSETASSYVKKRGDERLKELKNLIKDVVLCRMKDDKLKDLPKKTVNIVWFHICKEQRELYAEHVAKSSKFEKGFEAFQIIQRLRTISNHPMLLKGKDELGKKKFKDVVLGLEVDKLIQTSPKYGILLNLMKQFRKEGHCALIASQWTRTLDIVEVVLRRAGLRMARIDGEVPAKKRQGIVNSLETGNFDGLLLSTTAAGVGLNITAADRVIIADPDWTPSVDQQVIDRTHRLGQRRPVEAFYLIAAGTVGEFLAVVPITVHQRASFSRFWLI